MVEDIDGVRRALRGTPLGDLPITRIMGDTLVISGVDPADVLSPWRAARQVMPVTGRRPVFVEGDSPLLDDYHLPDDQEEEEDEIEEEDIWQGPSEADLRRLDHDAGTIDPWRSFYPRHWDQPAEYLEYSVGHFSGADLLAEVRTNVADLTFRNVNRYVYDRVRADPALLAQIKSYDDRLTGTGNWHQVDDVQLLLLPATEAHAVAGWISYHGALGQEAGLAAALWQWHRAWQAELVACWETMLQFTVGRRPESADDAWELALQLKSLAGNLEMEPWKVALVVGRGETWFLHDRP